MSAAAACYRLAAALLMPALSACVTTEGQVFTHAAAPAAALQTRLQLARSYIGAQNWEHAKRNLKLATELEPDAAELHEAFALVYQSTGEYELAEASFQRALALQEPFTRARNNYAVFLYSQGRFQQAAQQLEIVVKDILYESRPRAFVNLGLCRLRLHDSIAARAALQRALTMERGNRIALLELAHIEYEQSNWPAADRYLSTYRSQGGQQSSRALWLGVRLAHVTGNADVLASRALALRNLYPASAEFHAYERAVQNGEF